MPRLLLSLAVLLSFAFAAVAQIPGVRVDLYPRSLVTANGTVDVRMVILAELDAELPADLVSGVQLQVKVDDNPGPAVRQAGKGGAVAVTANTRIERVLQFPAATFLTNVELQQTATVSLAWEGMPGANCTFRIAPDPSRVRFEALDLAKTQVVLVTDYGEMLLQFRPDKAPRHVESFVKLSLQGFFDRTKFHRVISDFMLQGGCPLTKDDGKIAEWGQGGPGYTLNAEFNDLRHLRGTLAAARRGNDYNSAGSGFYICHKDAPQLDGGYTVFGNLVQGADTLDRIARVPVGGPTNSLPLQPVVLYQAIVLPVLKK